MALLSRAYRSDPRLRVWVSAYEETEIGHSRVPWVHRAMPDHLVRLSFHADADGPGPVRLRPAAVLAGLRAGAQDFRSQGGGRTLTAHLFPWGARWLFGWDAAQANLDLSLQPAAREICQLLGLGDWPAAREALDRWLLCRSDLRMDPPGKGLQAAQRLYTAHGTLRIHDLAEEVNLGPRQFERHFRDEVGLGAKRLARLVRFGEVQRRIALDPALRLTSLAYDLDFSDQAHLTKEFRALAQITPSRFAGISAARRRQEPTP